jgi:peptide-methionine (S)-S-oxide reductase
MPHSLDCAIFCRRVSIAVSFITLLVVSDLPRFVSAADAAKEDSKMKTATFGGGCFWCTEAVFQRLKGVEKIVSGYSGGHVENPTYEQVCKKQTGHAEVIQVTYDPKVVEYRELLEVFWKTHDPTTLNKQGADEGPQYRSVIFYHDEEQKADAEYYKEKLNESGYFKKPIVTEISPLKNFYSAEGYHQNYFNENPDQQYCRYVVAGKVAKFHEIFADKARVGNDILGGRK